MMNIRLFAMTVLTVWMAVLAGFMAYLLVGI